MSEKMYFLKSTLGDFSLNGMSTFVDHLFLLKERDRKGTVNKQKGKKDTEDVGKSE